MRLNNRDKKEHNLNLQSSHKDYQILDHPLTGIIFLADENP